MQISLGIAAGVGVFAAIALIPMYKWIARLADQRIQIKERTADHIARKGVDADTEKGIEPPVLREQSTASKLVKALTKSINYDVHESVETDAAVSAIHAQAEKFDPRTEAVFGYIQIFTAVFDSFAHGANGDCPLH